jgi:hypothetical protein
MKRYIWILLMGLAIAGCKTNPTSSRMSSPIKYQSGQVVSLGDRVKYHGQAGCIALIGREPGVGCSGIQRSDWNMNDSEVFILFDNGARLTLDDTSEDDLLVFCERKRK